MGGGGKSQGYLEKGLEMDGGWAGATRGGTRVGQEAGEEKWAGAFPVVSVGRNSEAGPAGLLGR